MRRVQTVLRVDLVQLSGLEILQFGIQVHVEASAVLENSGNPEHGTRDLVEQGHDLIE